MQKSESETMELDKLDNAEPAPSVTTMGYNRQISTGPNTQAAPLSKPTHPVKDG